MSVHGSGPRAQLRRVSLASTIAAGCLLTTSLAIILKQLAGATFEVPPMLRMLIAVTLTICIALALAAKAAEIAVCWARRNLVEAERDELIRRLSQAIRRPDRVSKRLTALERGLAELREQRQRDLAAIRELTSPAALDIYLKDAAGIYEAGIQEGRRRGPATGPAAAS